MLEMGQRTNELLITDNVFIEILKLNGVCMYMCACVRAFTH
jgi:hypothetical protein